MTIAGLEEIQQLDNNGQIPLYAKRDIALVRGEGCYLYDSDGKRYLDAMSNYGVAVLGHADPGFAETLHRQALQLTTCHQSFFNDARSEFLAELATICPEGVDRAFLSNSGTEAIEAALKFARATTGRTKLVAAKRAYHGRTFGALSATFDPKYRKPFEPLPLPATHVTFNDIDALEAAIDDDTAAVILEPIQGEAGIYPADDAYLQAARQLTRDRGVVLIADEIQSGFRTGTPWAMSHADVVADIVCTAKPVANGFPIGLTLVTEAISAALPGGTHGSTFGGNPLACAVGAYTLRTLRERDLYSNAAAVGAALMDAINAMNSPKIRQVRGRGLMVGIEMKERVTSTLKGLQENGVLVFPAGSLAFRVLPPMIWGQQQVDEFVAVLDQALHG